MFLLKQILINNILRQKIFEYEHTPNLTVRNKIINKLYQKFSYYKYLIFCKKKDKI